MDLPRVAAFAVVTLTLGSQAAAPTCPGRVKALKALAATFREERDAAASGPVEVRLHRSEPLRRQVEARDGWKARGVRLVGEHTASLDPAAEDALSRDLAWLATETRLELCVDANAPVERKHSLDADAKLVEPLLAELPELLAMDRATVVASHLEGPWSCPGVGASFTAVTHVAPADRLFIIARSMAEALEECRCPAEEAERVYAVVTLLADVWSDPQTCARLALGRPGQAAPLAVKGTVAGLVDQLAAAGAKGVQLKVKPAPARK